MTIEHHDYSEFLRLTDEETAELKAEILAAHARGDQDELARLREKYRSRASIVSSDRGPAISTTPCAEPAGAPIETGAPADLPALGKLN